MNSLLASAAALLLTSSTLAAQTASSLGTALRVPGTDVRLTLPPGFVAMPPDIIALKYSRGTPPTQVYSTPGPSWAVNIAFALRDAPLPAGNLAPSQKTLERSIENTPGFRWVQHGVERVAGRDWIVLRFWVDGLDTPIYNHLRVTRQGQKTLLVTANVTKKLYPRYAAQLDAAMQGLK